jgi:rhodanese-related sulfurtransferase
MSDRSVTMRRCLRGCALGALLSVALLLPACSRDEPVVTGPAAPSVVELSVEEARDLLARSPDLIPIDTTDYYFLHHLPGAISYPLRNGVFDEALELLDREGGYLVYGYTGEGSTEAAARMTAAGFHTVYSLTGGMRAWLAAGFPLARGGG